MKRKAACILVVASTVACFAAQTEQQFKEIDVNTDGQITSEELQTWLVERAKRGGRYNKNMTANTMVRLDQDKNGMLSFQEWMSE